MISSRALARVALRLSTAAAMITSTAAAAPSLDAVVGRTVRANYGAIHGCYRKVLADDRRRGGTLFVQVTLGAGDTVKSVRAVRDELGHEGATRCILGWVKGWTLRGAAAAGARMGSEITIPLTFRAAPEQFVVRGDDARQARIGRKGSARVLLHAGSVGGRAASLSLLTTGGRVTLPAVASDQALYVLSGRGRVGRHRLSRGKAVWIPPGVSARLTGALELLLAYVPGGPEQRLLDPQQGGRNPRVPRAKRTLRVTGTPLRRGGVVLAVERLAAGARWRRRAAKGVAMVYLVRGAGAVTVGERTVQVHEESAFYLAGGVTSAFAARKGTVLVRVTVPGAVGRRP